MAYRLDSTASDVATHRAAWSPAQAAEYAAHKDFLLLKLLSKHRGAFATARRLGYFNRASMHHAANTQSVAAPAQPIQRGAQTQTPRAEGTQRQRKGRERAAKYQARTTQATAATTRAESTQSATPTEPPLGAQRAPPAPTPPPSSDPSPGRQVEAARPEQPGREGVDVGRIGRTDVPPPEEPRDVDMDENTLVHSPGRGRSPGRHRPGRYRGGKGKGKGAADKGEGDDEGKGKGGSSGGKGKGGRGGAQPYSVTLLARSRDAYD